MLMASVLLAETAFPDMQDEEDHTEGGSLRHAPNPAAKPSRLATLRQVHFGSQRCTQNELWRYTIKS